MVEVNAVKSCPRFSGLPPQVNEWLAQRLQRRVYQKKTMLFLEGDSCDRLLIIERGVVKVFKTLESGRELILSLFRTGESVGEVALIDGDLFPASASAQEDTFMLELSRADYLEMGRLFPEALFSTIRDLTQRIRAMTQRVCELGSGGVEARLAQLFLSLSRSVQPTQKGVMIPFSMSRQELADMIGVRIETVIRAMSQLQKEEVVITQKSGFLLPNLDLLEARLHSKKS